MSRNSNIATVLLALLYCSVSSVAQAQELFVYTEPASNMPAHSLGLRLNNWFMKEQPNGALNYHFLPEAMWGVNKNLMLHVEGFFSNRVDGFGAEGVSLYGKYRFYSKDGVHNHLRLATYGRISYNSAEIHQEEIETNAHNSGVELGIIGTQLLHKQALSASFSYEQASVYPNRAVEGAKQFPRKALNYSFSAGRLILPKSYTGYGQTNFNIMLELLGQVAPESGRSYLDVAPSVQFIFNSQTRLDIGYRQELYSSMLRTAPNGFLVRLEHVFFNAIK